MTEITVKPTGEFSSLLQKEIKHCLIGGINYSLEELVIVSLESIHTDNKNIYKKPGNKKIVRVLF